MATPHVLHTEHWGPEQGAPGASDAPRALLLHGITSSGDTWWQIAEALAAAGWSVTAPDLRGHGASPRAESYQLSELADDVAALSAVHATSRSSSAESPTLPWDLLVGHSLGGAVAVIALAHDPAFARRAVLIDPATRFDPTGAGAFLTATLELIAHPDPEAYQAAHPTWHRRTIEAWVKSHQDVDPAAVSVILETNTWDAFGDAAATTVPVHVIAADPDLGAAFKAADGDALRAANANWTYDVIAGASHSVHRDEPQLVTDQLLTLTRPPVTRTATR
jgi:pimeloyl-ACP methyl ester carboxylesterase